MCFLWAWHTGYLPSPAISQRLKTACVCVCVCVCLCVCLCVCVCVGEGGIIYFHLSDTKQGESKKQLWVYNPNTPSRLINWRASISAILSQPPRCEVQETPFTELLFLMGLFTESKLWGVFSLKRNWKRGQTACLGLTALTCDRVHHRPKKYTAAPRSWGAGAERPRPTPNSCWIQGVTQRMYRDPI